MPNQHTAQRRQIELTERQAEHLVEMLEIIKTLYNKSMSFASAYGVDTRQLQSAEYVLTKLKAENGSTGTNA